MCVINDGAVSQHKFGASSILFFNTELLFPLKQVKTLADMMTSPYFFITDDRQISGFFYTCNLVYSVYIGIQGLKILIMTPLKSIYSDLKIESQIKNQFYQNWENEMSKDNFLRNSSKTNTVCSNSIRLKVWKIDIIRELIKITGNSLRTLYVIHSMIGILATFQKGEGRDDDVKNLFAAFIKHFCFKRKHF